jgi:hypothetical protein
MKYFFIIVFFLASCSTPRQIPRVAKILDRGECVEVWVWYGDGWQVATVDTLPPGIKKGKRLPDNDSVTLIFKRVNRAGRSRLY